MTSYIDLKNNAITNYRQIHNIILNQPYHMVKHLQQYDNYTLNFFYDPTLYSQFVPVKPVIKYVWMIYVPSSLNINVLLFHKFLDNTFLRGKQLNLILFLTYLSIMKMCFI